MLHEKHKNFDSKKKLAIFVNMIALISLMILSFFAGRTNFGVNANGASDLVYSVNNVSPDGNGNVNVSAVNDYTVNSNIPSSADFAQYAETTSDLTTINSTLSNLDATPSDVAYGKTFVGANGVKMTGSYEKFYIEAINATTITLSKVGSPTVGAAKYYINDGDSVSYTYGNSITLTAGDKCYWEIASTTTAFSENTNYLKFTSTGNINAGGDLSSLIGYKTSIPRDRCFQSLFKECTTLINAKDINFGSITTLSTNCYHSMFQGCTSLKTAPALPATTLANWCYQQMFNSCISLTTPPELPATTLAVACYAFMFYGCTSLKLSTTKTGNYQVAYRIPTTGTGTTTATDALTGMFTGTGGTFTGTPSINTTYYLAQ